MINNDYYEPAVDFDFESIYQKEELEEEVDYLKESIVLGAILDFLAPKRFTKDAAVARLFALIYVCRPHYFGKPNITQSEIASKHLGISKQIFINHVIEIRKKWGSEMIKDKECTIFLTLAGSTSAAGCMNIYKDLVKYNMVDAIVATGASIIDMDFFEALGFKHYQGSQFQDDAELRKNYIDRIYDTYIDEDELQMCDKKICEIADELEPRSYTSREFIYEIGKYLKKNSKKKDSLIETAYDNDVPIFCPAFTDSSAGFGLVMHQEKNPKKHMTIDSVREFRELTEIKIKSKGFYGSRK